MGYHRARFEVVGVDIKPQKNYPFEFHQTDAMTFPLDGYDVIHASPPCQAYSVMQHIHKNRHNYPDLVGAIRSRLLATVKPYVIENVYGSPLKNPLLLCGSYFGLKIPRHRYFETNAQIWSLFPPCDHRGKYDPWHGGEMARGERGKLASVMGIEHMSELRNEIRQAIPPAYTEWIGQQLMSAWVARQEGK